MALTAKGTPYVVSTDLVANYPTVSSDLADHIDDNLTYNAQTINAQTGSGANAYTFALADATAYKLVTATNAAAATYTVPPQASVTWVDGNVLRILNQGAGLVTLAGGAGVTLSSTSGFTLPQYAYAELHRTGSNAWTVVRYAPTGLTLVSTHSFSAVSSFSLPNSTFSATYENYRILLRGTASTTLTINCRLRASGTDNSGNIYYWGFEQFRTSNAFASQGAGGGNLPVIGLVSTTGGYRYAFDVQAPQLAVPTTIHGLMSGTDATSTYAGKFFISTPLDAIQFDALSVIASTGNITGEMEVYGYNT